LRLSAPRSLLTLLIQGTVRASVPQTLFTLLTLLICCCLWLRLALRLSSKLSDRVLSLQPLLLLIVVLLMLTRQRRDRVNGMYLCSLNRSLTRLGSTIMVRVGPRSGALRSTCGDVLLARDLYGVQRTSERRGRKRVTDALGGCQLDFLPPIAFLFTPSWTREKSDERGQERLTFLVIVLSPSRFPFPTPLPLPSSAFG
jgi:hypothetical protein